MLPIDLALHSVASHIQHKKNIVSLKHDRVKCNIKQDMPVLCIADFRFFIYIPTTVYKDSLISVPSPLVISAVFILVAMLDLRYYLIVILIYIFLIIWNIILHL